MELEQAQSIAHRIENALSPHCDRIHIAGSIRREKPNVKDIEIVCQPEANVVKDLFGSPSGFVINPECDGKAGTDGKIKWTCKHPDPTLPPIWVSEEGFFNWLGIAWIGPRHRT